MIVKKSGGKDKAETTAFFFKPNTPIINTWKTTMINSILENIENKK
jgi:hypothetical protein